MAIRKVTPTGGGGSACVILQKDGLEDDEVPAVRWYQCDGTRDTYKKQ